MAVYKLVLVALGDAATGQPITLVVDGYSADLDHVPRAPEGDGFFITCAVFKRRETNQAFALDINYVVSADIFAQPRKWMASSSASVECFLRHMQPKDFFGHGRNF